METLGRVLVGIVAFIVLCTGLFYALSYSFRDFHGTTLSAAVGMPSWQPRPFAYAEPAFDRVGVIVYYVQQGVEVPYFVYTVNGRNYSKALEFSNESICITSVEAPCPSSLNAFKTMYGSDGVRVQGIPDEESLIVTRITHAPVSA